LKDHDSEITLIKQPVEQEETKRHGGGKEERAHTRTKCWKMMSALDGGRGTAEGLMEKRE